MKLKQVSLIFSILLLSILSVEAISTINRISWPINPQVGTSYTVADGDRGRLVTLSNASPVAVTLPQAGASNKFTSGWVAAFENIGAGTVTITPTTSTIDGGASLTLNTNAGLFVFSNGTNYFTVRGSFAASTGDFSSNTSTSVDGEVVLFSGTGGKTGKRATITGIGKLTSGVLAAAAAGTDYTSPSDTETFTNKTFDSNATGNVLKKYEYVQLTAPDNGDGTNATRVTAEGATYGHFTFSNSVAKASNFILYRFRVPDDLDTATDLAASFSFRLGGADTGKHSYYISMADVNTSASADLPTFSNEVALSFAGDASGASGDMEQVAMTTLTSWKSSLTAGHIIVVKLARDGSDGTLDTSTVNSTDLNLTIRCGSSQ